MSDGTRPRTFLLSNENRRALLRVARDAILSAVSERRIPDLSPQSLTLSATGGAFVTLQREGRLRGCIGHMGKADSLFDVVAAAAINAALHDPRFPPVSAEEIAGLEIEISILSSLEPIAPESIQVGIHGLMVARGGSRGLLLPQVAVERGWAWRRFLEETCIKAGLAEDAWTDPSTSIYAFTAEVFSEATLRVGLAG